ncbi:MAG: hypothetical protein KC609_01360 [Myxococcales bacterium]|nr:hypothetical protein [Myxococcales bacterium]
MANQPTVRQALEGTWAIAWGDQGQRQPSTLGALILANGRYGVRWMRGAKPSTALLRRLPFLARRGGSYSVSLWRGVTPDRRLDRGLDVIAQVSFGAHKLLLRYDPKRNRLYFHGTVSELQLWSLTRQL